jgi:hypothetical protein
VLRQAGDHRNNADVHVPPMAEPPPSSSSPLPTIRSFEAELGPEVLVARDPPSHVVFLFINHHIFLNLSPNTQESRTEEYNITELRRTAPLPA